MAKGTAGKNYWALLLMILAGVVLGGFIGQLSAGVPALRWLNYGQTCENHQKKCPIVFHSSSFCHKISSFLKSRILS